jgi:hypothetical protein
MIAFLNFNGEKKMAEKRIFPKLYRDAPIAYRRDGSVDTIQLPKKGGTI